MRKILLLIFITISTIAHSQIDTIADGDSLKDIRKDILNPDINRGNDHDDTLNYVFENLVRRDTALEAIYVGGAGKSDTASGVWNLVTNWAGMPRAGIAWANTVYGIGAADSLETTVKSVFLGLNAGKYAYHVGQCTYTGANVGMHSRNSSNMSGYGGNVLRYDSAGIWGFAGGNSSQHYIKQGEFNTSLGAISMHGRKDTSNYLIYNLVLGAKAMPYPMDGCHYNVILSPRGFEDFKYGLYNLVIGYDIEPPTDSISYYMNIGDVIYGRPYDANKKVSIGSEPTSSKAVFEVNSTTKGMLPPRMTEAERDAISAPPAGLMIYNTTADSMSYYNGTAWQNY